MRPSPHNSKEKTRRTPRRRSLPPALRHPADTYSGLDRFGRTKQQLWRYYGGTPADRDRFEYTYDRNSNRTSKDLTLTAGKDEKYAYDGLNRLTSYDRGTLSEGSITDKVRNEAWGLSPTGNWSDYQIDADGDGNYTDATDLDQDRTHNPVNEIWNATPGNAITEQADPQQTQWADPAWDARGNMTSVPKPSDLTATYAATYDAWNRLAFVWVDSDADGTADAGETVIARYEYDGLNRRTKKHLNDDTDDDFDTFPHFFYNSGWQILETRKSTSENTGPETLQPEYQYVWSLRYIDAAVLRNENTDTDDLCDDERLYFANDANMNVTALMESDGDVVERYVYDPYGNCTVYNSDWSQTVSWANSKKNNIRFCGYYFDNETGLYNPRTRYYHPYFGCMITRDGGYWDGMSLYQYCRSSPLGRSDVWGLWGEVIHLEGTKKWAKQMNYREECATIIAEADNDVDDRIVWPWEVGRGPIDIIGDFSYHFDTDKTGRKKVPGARQAHVDEHLRNVEKAQRKGYAHWVVVQNWLKEIGIALHPLQDMSAHNKANTAATPFDHAPRFYCEKIPAALRRSLGITDADCEKAKASHPNWSDWNRPDTVGLGGVAETQCENDAKKVLRRFIDPMNSPSIYCYCNNTGEE